MKRKRKQTIRNQSQFTVPCPRRIQKTMLKNLQAAARNKISPIRAQKASIILAAISTDTNSANSQPKVIPTKKDIHVELAKPVLEVAERPSRAEGFVPSILGKIKTGFATIRQRFCYGIGIRKVNQSIVS